MCLGDDGGCTAPIHGYGYCSKHYQRWVKYGDSSVNFYARSKIDRFFSKVNKEGPVPEYRPDLGPCWIWNGTVGKDGYGVFSISRNVTRGAHRLSFLIAYGPIHNQLQIDHLCRVRLCVNPNHLEAVTSRVNTLRSYSVSAKNSQKTHCLKDHEFTEENTYIRVGEKKGRTCRECHRIRMQKRRHGNSTNSNR
jgi:hypothetical protein